MYMYLKGPYYLRGTYNLESMAFHEVLFSEVNNTIIGGQPYGTGKYLQEDTTLALRPGCL